MQIAFGSELHMYGLVPGIEACFLYACKGFDKESERRKQAKGQEIGRAHV